jgi:tetratricopeptide (TPR) repeat protein
MVKPSSPNDLAYRVVKLRLQRGTMTAQERRRVRGESEDVITLINRVRAAEALGDVDDLLGTADEILNAPPSRPLVDRALGLALLEQQKYGPASELLKRYLQFSLPDGERPFQGDVQAIQQLAIALSGTGDLVTAVARINELPPPMREDPESQGVLAGRFKRQWLKTPNGAQLGWRAFDLYRKAFETARFHKDVDQVLYNGINAAYLNFALGGTDFQPLAAQVLLACDQKASLDYWGLASRAEASLLRRDYRKAEPDYEQAFRQAPSPRKLATTAVQAIDIIARQGDPPDAAPIIRRLAPYAKDA